MIRLVAMDMAGTTIEEGGAVYTALSQAVAQSSGREVAEDITRNWMGADKHEAIRGMYGELGLEIDTQRTEEVYQLFTELLERAYLEVPPAPLPGIEAAFEVMRDAGCRVYLTTGFSKSVASGILNSIGWTINGVISDQVALDGAVTADVVGAGRPSPLMIQWCMNDAGITNPAEVAVAGDTILDVQAGLAAKAAITAGVLTGAQDRETLSAASPTHIFDGVVDLADHIAAVNATV